VHVFSLTPSERSQLLSDKLMVFKKPGDLRLLSEEELADTSLPAIVVDGTKVGSHSRAVR